MNKVSSLAWTVIANITVVICLGCGNWVAGADQVVEPLLPSKRVEALLKQIPEISNGTWVVVIYRQECGHCKEVLPVLWLTMIKGKRPDMQWCYVDVSDHDAGDSDDELVPIGGKAISVRLPCVWISTPQCIEVHDGKAIRGLSIPREPPLLPWPPE